MSRTWPVGPSSYPLPPQKVVKTFSILLRCRSVNCAIQRATRVGADVKKLHLPPIEECMHVTVIFRRQREVGAGDARRGERCSQLCQKILHSRVKSCGDEDEVYL